MASSTYPKFNDKEWDLLKAIANNTAIITDEEAGDVASVAGTANQVLVNGGTAAATGVITLSLPQSIATTSSPVFTGLTLSGLTATRVPFAGTAGVITDSSALTYASGTGILTATKFAGALNGTVGATTPAAGVFTSVTDSGLTSGRVPFASTGGLLTDAGTFTFSSGTLTLGTGYVGNSLTSAALSPLTLGTGTFGTSMTFASATGIPTFATAINYGGVALSASVVGTGSMALSASPAFTGTPTAPTATLGTNTTQLATTAFVQAALSGDVANPTGTISSTVGSFTNGSATTAMRSDGAPTLPATITGLNAITSAAVTNLVFTAGSSGASVTIGQGASGSITLTPSGSGSLAVDKPAQTTTKITIGNSSSSGFELNVTSADIKIYNPVSSTGTISFENSNGTAVRIANSRNLLLNGQTTDGALGAALQIPSTATAGLALYNTSDVTTNYEAYQAYWTGNIFRIGAAAAGSGQSRYLSLYGAATTNLQLTSATRKAQLDITAGLNAAMTMFSIGSGTTLVNTSGTVVGLEIATTYNQASGTAANTDLLINRTQTAVGSGAQLLADFQVGSVSKFSVSNTGTTTIAGDAAISTAGKTISIKSGSNAKAGTFTLSSGTVTVSNTSITANSVVCCTVKTSSGTLGTGTPEIVITAGTGFTATGIATDNSTYNYVVLEVN